MQNRKYEVEERIKELKSEYDLLNNIKETPSEFYEYLSSQRNLKEYIKKALETGSTRFEVNNSLPPFSEVIAACHEIIDLSKDDQLLPGNVVFVTQKTEGYKKEKERMKKEHKRDEKFEWKQENNEIQGEEWAIIPHMDLPPYNYYNSRLAPYNYGHRGMMDYSEYQHALYNPYGEYCINKEFKEVIPILNSNSKDCENHLVYPSQNALTRSPSFADIWGAKEKHEGLNRNAPPNQNKMIYEFMGKVRNNDQLPYEDFMNNDPENLFKDNNETENDARDEWNNDSDIIESLSQEEDCKNSKDFKFNELFDDSNSITSSQHINTPFKSLLEDSNDDDDYADEISNPNGGCGNDQRNIDLFADQWGKYSLDYYPDNEKEKVKEDGHMKSNRYVERLYPMDHRKKSKLYPERSHTGSRPNHPSVKDNSDIENYMKMVNRGIDMSTYYKSHKIHKPDLAELNMMNEKSLNKGRKRNKYKMLPTDLKHKAVELAQQKGAKYSAAIYSVPLKSLKRWMKVGCERKKGGGRKTKDPAMEKNLYNWYREKKNRGENITAKMIKEKAIELTNCDDFIASKGWLDKFKVRFNLEISKESSKDNNRRRSLNGTTHKRNEIECIRGNFYNDDIDHYQSYRRSLNKSNKQEISKANNKYFNEESNRIVVCGDNRSLKTPQKSNNFKKEDLLGIENSRKYNKNNYLSSAFPSIQNDNQFKKSKRADKSYNNVISLPLCDNEVSE